MHIEAHQRQVAVKSIESWQNNEICLTSGEAIRVKMTREEITAKIEASNNDGKEATRCASPATH